MMGKQSQDERLSNAFCTGLMMMMIIIIFIIIDHTAKNTRNA